MGIQDAIKQAFEAVSGAIPEVVETVAYSGTRRERGSVRNLSFSLKVIATEGSGDLLTVAAAPSRAQSWTLRVLEQDWPEATPPHVNDKVRFSRRTGLGEYRVSNVARHGNLGYLTLTVESGDGGKW